MTTLAAAIAHIGELIDALGVAVIVLGVYLAIRYGVLAGIDE